jgi:hypothetical protein
MDANTRQLGGQSSGAMASRASKRRDDEPRPMSRSLGQESEGVPGADNAAHKHEGSFGAGQELIEHHPERRGEKGDFAAGEELEQHTHQGSFAEGQEQADPHPELLENRGGFAAGQRREVGASTREDQETDRLDRTTTSSLGTEMDVYEEHSGPKGPDAMASGVPGPDEEGPEAMASGAPGSDKQGLDAMASGAPGLKGPPDAMSSDDAGPDEEGPESMASGIPGPQGPDAMASGA